MDFDKLKKLKNGSHIIFKEVYEETYKKVFNYFIVKTKSEANAQELTQQTFIKLWVYRAAIEPNLTIDQQIFRKAKQVLIDWWRVRRVQSKHINEDMNLLHQEICEPISTLKANNELSHTLRVALESLPQKRKQVFELKHLDGMSYKEIAKFLGISIKTVDNHLMKASAQLRKFFNLFLAFII